MDPAKFPDPKAFFDWARVAGAAQHAQHPPQHRAAPTRSSRRRRPPPAASWPLTAARGDCYIFDWGDPDQLKAYFDLHQAMEQQGADFWWLDWCCDSS